MIISCKYMKIYTRVYEFQTLNVLATFDTPAHTAKNDGIRETHTLYTAYQDESPLLELKYVKIRLLDVTLFFLPPVTKVATLKLIRG